MPQNYIVIGGGAYQPGSAAAKRAQELYAAMPKQVPQQNSLSSYMPQGPRPSYPANFPSYPTGGGMAGRVGGGGGTLSPGPAVTGQGAFGLVPTMPNPIATAGGAIAGNQANLPALSTLGRGVTGLNADLAKLPFQMNFPNYEGLIGQRSANIGSNLAGQISKGTSDAITRAAAERGVAMGSAPNSPNTMTNWMGVLGQTSEQLQALGQNQLNSALATTPTGLPFNAAGMQVGPTDMQAAQWEANKLGAAPDPTMAAQANLDMLLRAIEAGRAGANQGFGGGFGGGGSPGFLRMPTAPGAMAIAPSYYGGGAGGGGGSYAPRARTTTSGRVPPSQSGYGYDSPADVTQFGQQYLNTFLNPGSGQWMNTSETLGALTNPLNLGGYNVPKYGNSNSINNISPYEYDYTYEPEYGSM